MSLNFKRNRVTTTFTGHSSTICYSDLELYSGIKRVKELAKDGWIQKIVSAARVKQDYNTLVLNPPNQTRMVFGFTMPAIA